MRRAGKNQRIETITLTPPPSLPKSEETISPRRSRAPLLELEIRLSFRLAIKYSCPERISTFNKIERSLMRMETVSRITRRKPEKSWTDSTSQFSETLTICITLTTEKFQAM